MPTLEQYVYDRTHQLPETYGQVEMVSASIIDAISTRPFLTAERMEGIRRRGGQEFPHLVLYRGIHFVIDGHHKIRRALNDGHYAMFSKVLETTNESLAEELFRMSHGLVKDLEIRE